METNYHKASGDNPMDKQKHLKLIHKLIHPKKCGLTLSIIRKKTKIKSKIIKNKTNQTSELQSNRQSSIILLKSLW